MNVLPFSASNLEKAADILKQGGVIAHATETCYGLACDLRNPLAVKKVFAIKHRSETQPVSGLFQSVEDAKKWIIWNEKADALAAQYLPGPLTLILPIRSDAPAAIFPMLLHPTTLGVRISSHPHAAALTAACRFPLSTTSANLHGKANPYSAEDIIEQFEGQEFQPDLILDSGELPQVPPSTVINLTADDQTVRAGTIQI
jgi:L-threonylcarbamoyladenylate synthase